ncbi:MAG: hypothetical protein HWD92_07470 [Flavobacteriia bacterium]|nr:hypothetical protein [Flavobacteriia bacterium]
MNTLIKLGFLSTFAISCTSESDSPQETHGDFTRIMNEPALEITQNLSDVLSPPANSYITVQNDKGRTLEMESGLVLTVPKNAFLNPDGSLYEGEVTLKVKDMTQLREIVESGIRMDAKNENGEYEPFASAGMFSVLPLENVSINPEAPIAVEIPVTDDQEYPLWQLDTLENEWNQVQPRTEVVTTTETEDSEVASISLNVDCYLGEEENTIYFNGNNTTNQLRSNSFRRQNIGVKLEGLTYRDGESVYALSLNEHDLPSENGFNVQYFTMAGDLLLYRPHSFAATCAGWEAPMIVPASSIPGKSYPVSLHEQTAYVPEFKGMANLHFKPYSERDGFILEGANLSNVSLRKGEGPFYDLYIFDGRYDKSHRKARVVPVYHNEINSLITRANERTVAIVKADSAANVLVNHIACEYLNNAQNTVRFDELESNYINLIDGLDYGTAFLVFKQWRLRILEEQTGRSTTQALMVPSSPLSKEVTMRFLEITEFGYYNCDRFYRVPSIQSFITFSTQQDSVAPTISFLRLIDEGENAVIDFNVTMEKEYYNLGINRDYKFLAMSQDNELFYGKFTSPEARGERRVELILESENFEGFMEGLGGTGAINGS